MPAMSAREVSGQTKARIVNSGQLSLFFGPAFIHLPVIDTGCVQIDLRLLLWLNTI